MECELLSFIERIEKNGFSNVRFYDYSNGFFDVYATNQKGERIHRVMSSELISLTPHVFKL